MSALRGSPPNREALSLAIQESHSLLDLPNDWDGEGSPGYAESTWTRAVDFLLQNAERLWQDQGVEVSAPAILPGPDGSIDLHWNTKNHELLLNIPADPGGLAEYYGDTVDGNAVSGKLTIAARNQWLLMWLAE